MLWDCKDSHCGDLHVISAAHTSSVWRVFPQWKMTAVALKEDMPLLGVVIQHS